MYGVKMVDNYGLWLQAGRNPAEYTKERRELCKAYFLVVHNYGLWLQAGRNPAEYTEERRDLLC
jgi:hypothetical protein